VHQYRGEFLLFQAAREDKPGAEVAAEAEAHFKVGGWAGRRAGGWVGQWVLWCLPQSAPMPSRAQLT
jgi:hypothetical protein